MSMDTQDLLDRIAHGATDQDDAEAVRGIIEERDRLHRQNHAVYFLLNNEYDGSETPNGSVIAQSIGCLCGDEWPLWDTEKQMQRSKRP